MIAVSIDDASPVPPFEQLRSQIAGAIRAGALEPGTALPPIRQLAGDLGLAANTVARAYKALEEEHLVVANGRRGTAVAHPGTAPPSSRDGLLTAAARRYLAEATRLGVGVDEALAAAKRAASAVAMNVGGGQGETGSLVARTQDEVAWAMRRGRGRSERRPWPA